ncbi:entericidin B precursor [Citrobacter amalonaticus]|uniref:Entericidin B n=1 Tax=Citrobacter amalonaticus TaxID=35703 RepID=A0A2S4RU62_CITAM|nr:entericidin B precursor [Citrobacter amalonaticus]POT72593.1 entericidin B precursor [Citrobacter amalonaticus]POU63448.1 entericidin B precursor [Citrobacter amalonaticus]POV03212.1 entericidin B precursor [Citrobacter amalonaticus]
MKDTNKNCLNLSVTCSYTYFARKVIPIGKQRFGEGIRGVTNSKVVFYIHLQLIKDNILNVVICYT